MSITIERSIQYSVNADYDNYQRVLHEIAKMETALLEDDADSYPEWDDIEAKRNELIRMFDNTPSFSVKDFETVAPLLRYCDSTDHVINDNMIHVMKRWCNDLRMMNYLELNKGRKIAFLDVRSFGI